MKSIFTYLLIITLSYSNKCLAELQPTTILLGQGYKAAVTPEGWVGNKYWEDMGTFSEDRCAVSKAGKWAMINRNGDLLTEFIYDKIWSMKSGLALYRIGNESGYLNNEGKVIFKRDKSHTYIQPAFVGNKIVYKENGYYGLVDKSGKEYLPAKYKGIAQMNQIDFSCFIVKENSFWHLIDKVGKPLNDRRYKLARSWVSIKNNQKTSHRARVLSQNNKWGFIDEKGYEIIPPIYEDVKSFDKKTGLAPVQDIKTRHWGVINYEGKLIIPFKYDHIERFREGVSVAKKDNKFYLINRVGKVILLDNDEIFSKTNGYLKVKNNTCYGLVDSMGRIIYDSKYSHIINSKGFYPIVVKSYTDFIVVSGKDKNQHKIISSTALSVPFEHAVIEGSNGDYLLGVDGWQSRTYDESISLISKNYYSVSKNQQPGIVDAKDNLIVDFGIWLDIYDAKSDIVFIGGKRASGKYKYGLVSFKNPEKWVGNKSWRRLEPLTKGFFTFSNSESGGLWGIINTKGDIIVEEKYSQIELFDERKLLIITTKWNENQDLQENKEMLHGLIHLNGNILLETKYSAIISWNNTIKGRKKNGTFDILPKKQMLNNLNHPKKVDLEYIHAIEKKKYSKDTIVYKQEQEQEYKLQINKISYKLLDTNKLPRPQVWEKIEILRANEYLVTKRDKHLVRYFGIISPYGASSPLQKEVFKEVRISHELLIDSGHLDGVKNIGSSGANLFATLDANKRIVKFWSNKELKQTWHFNLDWEKCEVSSDGSFIAFSNSTRVAIYNIKSQKKTFEYFFNYHPKFKFSKKNNQVAIFDSNGVRIVDIMTSTQIAFGETEDIHETPVSFENGNILTLTDEGIRKYRYENGKITIIKRWNPSYAKGIEMITISPDRKLFATGWGNKRLVSLHKIDSLKPYKYLPCENGKPDKMQFVAWMNDGRLATASTGWCFHKNKKQSFGIRVWPANVLLPNNKVKVQPLDIALSPLWIDYITPAPNGGIIFSSQFSEVGTWKNGEIDLLCTQASPKFYANAFNQRFKVSPDLSSFSFEMHNRGSIHRFDLNSRRLSNVGKLDLLPDDMRLNQLKGGKWDFTKTHAIHQNKKTKFKLKDTIEKSTKGDYNIKNNLFLSWENGDAYLYDLEKIDFKSEYQSPRSYYSSPHVFSARLSNDGKMILAACSDGVMRWFDAETTKILLNFFAHPDGKRWVLWAPSGYFMCSNGAESLIGWKVSKSDTSLSTFYPCDQLYDLYYRPDIIQRVFNEVRPASEIAASMGIQINIETALKQTPDVKIKGPENNTEIGTRTISLEAVFADTGGGIKDASLFHNGKRVLPDGPASRGARGKFKTETLLYNVTLLNGENTFSASAANNKGSVGKIDKVTVHFNGVKATSNLHVFTVGINRYKNARYNLTYCKADADALSQAFKLKSKGLFKNVYQHQLNDENATLSEIEKNFKKLASEVKPNDVFIFCYAGHGVMSEASKDNPSEFYLVLHDVTGMYGNTEILKSKGASRKQLEKWCAKIPARKQLMLLDTCQSGGLVDKFAMRGVSQEKAIAQLARSSGTVVIASTGAQAYARESKEIGHGIFTKSVLDGLGKGKADVNKDGRITIKELDAYINRAVPELSLKILKTAQYPTSYSRGQDFPIGLSK